MATRSLMDLLSAYSHLETDDMPAGQQLVSTTADYLVVDPQNPEIAICLKDGYLVGITARAGIGGDRSSTCGYEQPYEQTEPGLRAMLFTTSA